MTHDHPEAKEYAAFEAASRDHHGLDSDRQVFFYEQEFYVLSNFSAFAVRLDVNPGTADEERIRFPTAEHAYHFLKFPDFPGLQALILNASSAHDAFQYAQRERSSRREDWDAVKLVVMEDILRAKVQQHEYVRRKLIETGDRELIENSWRDDVWGWGPKKDGQNLLGKLWMKVRADLIAGRIPL